MKAIRDQHYYALLNALCSTCRAGVARQDAHRRFWQGETWPHLCNACENVTEYLCSEPDNSPHLTGIDPLRSGDVVWLDQAQRYQLRKRTS